MISIYKKVSNDLSVSKKEVMRFLGVKKEEATFEDLYAPCVQEVKCQASPKAAYIYVPINVTEDTVDFGFMVVKSKNLSKNLQGCDSAYIFCATLGIGVDRHYEKLSKISQARATVFSAVGSSLVESLCDSLNEMLIENKKACPRFSCGYGDFSIEHQRDILSRLDADKTLGVYLTDACMMVPVKTVTAVVGIRR